SRAVSRPPPLSPLVPYTTLFRSRARAARRHLPARPARRDRRRSPLTVRARSSCVPQDAHSGHLRRPMEATVQNVGADFVKEFRIDRKSTRLNSSHVKISYAVFCL